MTSRITMAIVCVMAVALKPTSSHAQSAPHAPPTFCEIRQSAWCILYSDVSYKDAPSKKEGYASHWIVKGGTWKDNPLVINEPKGCRNGKSDTVDLIGSEEEVKSEGRTWTKIRVRIKKDKSCDLEFLYPPAGSDPQEGAFLAAMTIVKACGDQNCSSPPLGLFIRPKLNR